MPKILRCTSLLWNAPETRWKSDPGSEEYEGLDHEKQAKDEALGPLWTKVHFVQKSPGSPSASAITLDGLAFLEGAAP